MWGARERAPARQLPRERWPEMNRPLERAEELQEGAVDLLGAPLLQPVTGALATHDGAQIRQRGLHLGRRVESADASVASRFEITAMRRRSPCCRRSR